VIVRVIIAALVLAVTSAMPARAVRQAASTSGYTVSATADGVEVSVHFARRDFPRHALVAVTATIRNLSDPHLATTRMPYPYGLCQWPVVSLESVTATGQSAAPVQPIPVPMPSCPAPMASNLPIGHAYSERQFIVLWSDRLQVSAQLFNFVHHCECGFEFPELIVPFTLHAARPGKITVQHRSGLEVASVTPPPEPHGPLYMQSWGTCPSSGPGGSTAFYWVRRRGTTLPAMCPVPTQWHLDVAWLNTSVSTLNLRSK
jgi:hypothetical protein